jgi:hypothetical protein
VLLLLRLAAEVLLGLGERWEEGVPVPEMLAEPSWLLLSDREGVLLKHSVTVLLPVALGHRLAEWDRVSMGEGLGVAEAVAEGDVNMV